MGIKYLRKRNCEISLLFCQKKMDSLSMNVECTIHTLYHSRCFQYLKSLIYLLMKKSSHKESSLLAFVGIPASFVSKYECIQFVSAEVVLRYDDMRLQNARNHCLILKKFHKLTGDRMFEDFEINTVSCSRHFITLTRDKIHMILDCFLLHSLSLNAAS
jgi:hypothetical protein